MTLTRARAMAGGYYVTSLKRRTDTEEMMHMQGISSASLGDWVPHLKRTDVNAAIGNAMSVNVGERLLFSLFTICGYLIQFFSRSMAFFTSWFHSWVYHIQRNRGFGG